MSFAIEFVDRKFFTIYSFHQIRTVFKLLNYFLFRMGDFCPYTFELNNANIKKLGLR